MSERRALDWKTIVAHVPQTGRVAWIGRAPASHAPLEVVQRVRLEQGTGLAGEHHAQRGGGERQVTLIQAEHLAAASSVLGRAVEPGDVRRNLGVEGLNLLSLKGRRFRVGDALLEHTGPCAPCMRMEQNLGEGGYQAMRGHGGICARVLEGGDVGLGDAVTAEPGGGLDGGED